MNPNLVRSFQVLSPEDEIALRRFADELSGRVDSAVTGKDYVAASQALKQLCQFEIIGNIFVSHLIKEAVLRAGRFFSRIERDCSEFAAFGDFDKARSCIDDLKRIETEFKDMRGMPDMKAMIQKCSAVVQRAQNEKDMMARMQDALNNMTDTTEALEDQLKFINEQKQAQLEDIEQLKEDQENMERKVSEEREEMEKVTKPS